VDSALKANLQTTGIPAGFWFALVALCGNRGQPAATSNSRMDAVRPLPEIPAAGSMYPPIAYRLKPILHIFER